MRYLLQFKNTSPAPATETLVADKVKALEKFTARFDQNAVEARVEVGMPSKHHRSGMVFYAEINLKVPGKLLRAEATHLDLNYAINEAFREIERQVKKYKEKLLRSSTSQ